jgi:hypothetical protein
MEELEPTYEDIYKRIKAHRIELWHPVVFTAHTHVKSQVNTPELLISESGGVLYR